MSYRSSLPGVDTLLRRPEQLGPLLKSLRRRKGWSQARLGSALGVSQTRVAQIETNPGSVSFEQVLEVLRALSAGMVITSSPSGRTEAPVEPQAAEPVVAKPLLFGSNPKGRW